MTNRQIETSREIRLWFSGIVIPTVGLAIMIETNPQLKSKVKEKTSIVKEKVKKIFKK